MRSSSWVPPAAVDDFGGFEGQYEQIEKVVAHHGNYGEVLLYGHLLKTAQQPAC